MEIVCIGPNLPDQRKGSFHVHAKGCADVVRNRDYLSPEFAFDKTNGIEAETMAEVVKYVYADQLAEDADLTIDDCVNDFHVFDCAQALK